MPRLMSMNPLQTLGHSLAAVAQLQELYMPGLDLDCTYLPPLPGTRLSERLQQQGRLLYTDFP